MKTAVYDLHCHSTASDGSLSPSQLVGRAREKGVTTLALTDHDTTAGLAEASLAAVVQDLKLIAGIELSANYHSHCLHIVGLNINPANEILQAGIALQHQLRAERAKQIAAKLVKKRLPDPYPSVIAAAGNGEITRLHFADFLVAQGIVSDQQQAFDRYLSKGKPGYVPTQWAGMAETVNWISAAGGVAILAHPLRYNLSHKWLNRVLDDFKQAGGMAVEVVTGRASAEDIRISAGFAIRHQLLASVGSDFHSPENQWVELGRLANLPSGLKPVWELFL